MDDNQVLAAHRGREPGLCLARERSAVPLTRWADDILQDMLSVAELLDGGADGPHRRSIAAQRTKVADPEATPSARMLATMRERRESFFEFAQGISEEHREFFLRRTLDAERQAAFDRLSLESIERQKAIEEADTGTFDAFLLHYFEQGRGPNHVF